MPKLAILRRVPIGPRGDKLVDIQLFPDKRAETEYAKERKLRFIKLPLAHEGLTLDELKILYAKEIEAEEAKIRESAK